MSMRQLHDLSRVYLEQVASVDEAVKGQDTEMRKVASAERQKERKERGGHAPKIPGREGPSAAKSYADYQQISISKHDKLTKKNKNIVGLVAKEEAKPDYLDFDKDGNKKESMKKALKDKAKHKVEEAKKPNDGNLANNYPPYDKVTRGDVIAGAIGKDQMGGKKKVKSESFSNWRQDLSEVMDKITPNKEENEKEIKEKTVKNKVVINPDFKEAVEEIGGQLIEMVEIDEKTLTPAETKKKEDIVMSMKKKGDFSKYGKRAKEVMYATATKQAKKLVEADMPQETQPSDKRAQTQQKQRLLQILQQKERAVRSGMTDISASYEVEGELVDEARASEKRGMGSPEKRSDVSRTGYLSGTRAQNKERGEKGGRHHYSGSVEYGGSEAERGRKKVKGAKGDENKYTQHGRTQVFQGRTETSGKYSEMQRKKRGGDIGSRFD